jgi:hypothetical protein
MPTFDASPATKTRKYGATDNALPPLGQIQLLPSSLPSQEQDLVHGNVKRDITGDVRYSLMGNQTNTTTKDVIDTIVGNHTYTLTKNLHHTVQGNTNQSKLGTHFTSNVGQVTNINVGPVTRSFQAPTTETHPEEWYQQFNTQRKAYFLNESIGVRKIDCYAFVLAADLAKLSIDASKMDLVGIQLKVSPGKTVELVPLAMQVKVASCKLIATALLIGVLSLGTPFKPNALPRPTPITPFD